jgi:hypothetical protein
VTSLKQLKRDVAALSKRVEALTVQIAELEGRVEAPPPVHQRNTSTYWPRYAVDDQTPSTRWWTVWNGPKKPLNSTFWHTCD